jgi:galactokinase
VPGRIEFLGKHTDYAGGRSLVCACEHGFAIVARIRTDLRVSATDALSGQTADGMLDPDLDVPRAHWSNYLLTVARRVARNFPGVNHGVDLAFASDLPPAAGLSSSSALVVATFLALADANNLVQRPEYRRAIKSTEDLAAYLGSVENGQGFHDLAGDQGVGTTGGSQDHTAILCSRRGMLAQYGFAPVRLERVVPFPADHLLVVAASGITAVKTGNALEQYNRASKRVAAAVRAWQARHGSDRAPTLAAVLGTSSADTEGLRDAIRAYTDTEFDSESLLRRVEQFEAESVDIIPAAGDALLRGDLMALGTLVDRSQANAERLLENQIPETIALAHSARELGAVAASAFGAGFGGSVYALVPASDAAAFQQRWSARYAREFSQRAKNASFFVTRAGPPAARL